MTYYFLYIEVQFRQEVIERVLRVIRHRGFTLYSLNVSPCGGIDTINNKLKLHMYITLLGKRSINILYAHLNKLIDVSYIVIQGSNRSNNFSINTVN